MECLARETQQVWKRGPADINVEQAGLSGGRRRARSARRPGARSAAPTKGRGRTCTSSSAARAQPSPELNVLLPTPPLPLKTRIFFLTRESRSRISGRSGSGSLGSSEAQND